MVGSRYCRSGLARLPSVVEGSSLKRMAVGIGIYSDTFQDEVLRGGVRVHEEESGRIRPDLTANRQLNVSVSGFTLEQPGGTDPGQFQ